MNIQTGFTKIKGLPSQQYSAAMVVFSEVWPIIVRHKKKVIVALLIELWIHGLATHHIQELKSFMEAIPFFGH